MFKSEARSGTETIIGPSVHVEGDLTSQGDIVVEGAVTGTIATSGNLTVGDNAAINANVQAASAYVAGKLKGNLTVSERLELAATSRVAGDISTKVLVVAEGAQFEGRCQMGGSSAPASASVGSARSKKEKPVAEA